MSSSAETSRILQLAQTIAAKTELIDTHLRSHNHAAPSFDASASIDPVPGATPEVSKAKIEVIEATIELRQLLEGPVKALLPEANLAPLAAVYRFNIASHVPAPPSPPISITDLSSKCNILPHDLQRIIRFTSTHHRVFTMPSPASVTHTAASLLLRSNPQIADIMGLTFAECWPAHARCLDAIARQSEEPNVSGYALANGTESSTFDFLNANPERAKRFAGAMGATSQTSLDALAGYFDWRSLGEGSLVVDVGGSKGHVSSFLAGKFPGLKFVVQDMGEVVKGAEEGVPVEVAGRVSFQAHDMFSEQTVKDADVYFLRFVLHDWPDKYCVKVLKALIPALKKGAKVVLQDHLLPEPGTLGLLQEMQMTSMDAIMLSLFNSRERAVEDWRAIFEMADERFVDFQADRVKESPSTGIVVVTWAGENL